MLRRDIIWLGLCGLSGVFLTKSASATEVQLSDTIDLLGDAGVFSNAGGREEAYDLAGIFAEADVRTARRSSTIIHPDAIKLIVACEVSGPHTYEKRYRGAIWPRGRSGVTIGVGYDLGYVTKKEFSSEWLDYTTPTVIKALETACGVTGIAARDLLPKLPSISIPFKSAYDQFSQQVLPRYTGSTEDALPNTSKLSALSLGALVSLTYNRGPSYIIPKSKDANGRYTEMRNIRTHMASGEFDKIPGEIKAMARLWENNSDATGVVVRRKLEAQLFEAGLR